MASMQAVEDIFIDVNTVGNNNFFQNEDKRMHYEVK